jgi:hypothetical protein
MTDLAQGRRVTFNRGLPFSRADATAAGLTLATLRTLAYRRLFPGVFVNAATMPTDVLRARAALVPFPPTAFASHASAARIYGVPLPVTPDEHITVLRQQDRRRRLGIKCHLSGRATIRTIDGVRVSSPIQMFIELAGMLSLVDLVIVGDYLARQLNVSPERLRERCATHTGRDAVLLRRAAALVRAGVDSPMETRLRLLIVLAGLPEPEVNFELRAEDGYLVRRYDLCYPAAKIAIEYDGRQHIEREKQWEADLARREAGDDEGWRLLVVTSRGIFREADVTLDRIWRLARARKVPGTPVRLKDDWRPYFRPRPAARSRVGDSDVLLSRRGRSHRPLAGLAEGFDGGGVAVGEERRTTLRLGGLADQPGGLSECVQRAQESAVGFVRPGDVARALPAAAPQQIQSAVVAGARIGVRLHRRATCQRPFGEDGPGEGGRRKRRGHHDRVATGGEYGRGRIFRQQRRRVQQVAAVSVGHACCPAESRSSQACTTRAAMLVSASLRYGRGS